MADFPELAKTPLQGAFSAFGSRVYLPQGIFYWAAQARAVEINGTIGDAKGNELNEFLGVPHDKSITFFLKNMNEHLGSIDASVISSYAPIAGVPELRSRWKEWILDKTGLKDVPGMKDVISSPVVTCGVTNSIYHVVRLFAGEGETVLTCDKYWENYATIIELNAGASLTTFPTFAGGEFNVAAMVSAIEASAAKQGKAVLLLNFPNNPTGYVPSTTAMERISAALVDVAGRTGKPVIVLVDDAYEGYVYDDAGETRSLFAFLVDKHPNLVPVKLDGASKEFLFYGGRVAFVTFGFSRAWGASLAKLDEELGNKLSGAIRGTNSNATHLAQMLVLKVMEDMATSLANRQKVIDVLKARYDTFRKHAGSLEDAAKGITFDPYQGGFFAFLNLPANIPAEEFARKLLKEHGLGIVPASLPALGVNGIRIAFCSMPERAIGNALERIRNALE